MSDHPASEPIADPVAEVPPAATAAMPEVSPPPAAPAVSAGTLLRQAREAAGIGQEDMARTLKVPVKKLDALETDQIDVLPDAVFARALAASVCRHLGMDAAPVLAALPQTARPSLRTEASTINQPFRANNRGVSSAMLRQLARPIVLAVLALVVGAGLLLWLPAGPPRGDERNEVADVVTQGKSVMVTESPAIPLGAVASAVIAAPARPVVPEVGTTPAALMPTPRMAEPPAAVAAPSPTVAAAPAPSTAGTELLVFKAREESWVEVRESGKANTLLRKTLAAGESVSVSGSPPLSVTVGRADATDVLLRGQAYPLTAWTRENVARFEVK